MSRKQRILMVALAALVVASGLSFGLVKAYAQDEPALGSISSTELLEKVLDRRSPPSAVSGDVVVTNELLGSFPVEFARAGGGGPATFLQSGGGRLWAQGDKVRIDAQGVFNDTVLYYDGEKVTIYDSTANTLTVYTLPELPTRGNSGQDEQDKGMDSTVFDPQTVIPRMIEKLAPVATLAVDTPERVAGRECHILTLTPTAPNTLLGSVRVAVDGQTYLPLQVAIYAKGYSEPVFLAGFTSVSYDPIDDSVFEVPSPPGAKTEQKQLEWPSDRLYTEVDVAGATEPMTVEEASTKAGFEVLAAETTDPDYAFRGAWVLDLPEGPSDLGADGSRATSDTAENGAASGEVLSKIFGGLADEADGLLGGLVESPVVVQVYGQGFGTVVMIQVETPSIPPDALQSMQADLPFFQAIEVDGTTALRFSTPLASLVGWQHETVTIIVAGCVPATDLTTFAASVR